MFIIQLRGGLGNQMFQYAFGRSLSIRNNEEFRLDVNTGFEGDFFERTFRLKYFNISTTQAARIDLKKYRFYSHNYLGRFISKVNNSIIELYPPYIIKEKDCFIYDEKINTFTNDHYYSGYWQNLKYFENIRETLLRDFSLADSISDELNASARELMDVESVAIHIRFPHAYSGNKMDDRTFQKYQVLSKEYYQKAISLIKAKTENPEFYLFCDNVDYALNLLKGVEFKKNIWGEDYLDLFLMSKCKHQIIANSTFSWWAAWLNINPGKVIISPKLWFNINSNISDALLKDFTLVD